MEMSNFEEEAENIFPDWFKSIDWRRWDAPLNLTIGESRRNDAIAALAGAPRRHGYLIPVTATLLRDSNNPVDRNAIKVEIQTVQVGYVRHEVAFHLSPIFDSDNARTCEVAAIIRGGSLNAPNFGVHLWLDKTLSPAPCMPGRLGKTKDRITFLCNRAFLSDGFLFPGWISRRAQREPRSYRSNSLTLQVAGFLASRGGSNFITLPIHDPPHRGTPSTRTVTAKDTAKATTRL